MEDGRLGLSRLAAGSRDLVVGDAFGGLSVPWHLTTREAVGEVGRVLAADGVYVVNLIDHRPLAFARAEVATLADGGPPRRADGPRTPVLTGGGNLVAIASPAPIDTEAIAARPRHRDTGWQVQGAELDAGWTRPRAHRRLRPGRPAAHPVHRALSGLQCGE